MSIFNQLKQSLIAQLGKQENAKGLVQLSASVSLLEDANLLGWLKSQGEFPQMFWQHRSEKMCFAAIGAIHTFGTLEDAEAFSREYGVRLVGGIQFEGKVNFILPRLLLWKNDDKLSGSLHFYIDDLDEVHHFVHQLADSQNLQSQHNRLISQQQLYDFATWSRNIQNAIFQIQSGHFDKVVLANATQLDFENPLSAYDLLAKSRQKNSGCFHFLWAENAKNYFIGSSPERLYQRKLCHFLTEALAGTVSVGKDEIETAENALWLLNDHKNRYENWLVVDDICEHLADCAGDIKVGDAHIKRLRNVQHLRRFIQTELVENVTDRDCLALIHPTAAVAGLPRSSAKLFIQQHEPFERQWYAGTLGYLSVEQAEFCVTLRSAQIQQHQMIVYAGAGIVAESEAESEWQEIERKSLAMVSLVLENE